MKVLVTGGSGFVGREITRQLVASGHSVRGLARKPAAPGGGIETRVADITDAATLRGALSGVDAIIHLVGIISECGRNTFENVHTTGTRNLVNEAKAAGVARFIHMSALGVRPAAVARYHQSKWAAEEIVRQSGLEWTIFRPSIIYGKEDQFVNLFAQISRFSPLVPVMGDGQSKMQPTPVHEVVMGFVGALTERKSIGQTYDLCGPEPLTFDQILRTILDVTGRRRMLLHLPMGLARIQARVMEIVFPKLLRRPSPLNRDQLLMLAEDNVGNPKPAAELFELQHISFRTGISAYLT